MNIFWIVIAVIILAVCVYVIGKKLRDQFVYGKCDGCNKNCSECKSKNKHLK